MNKLVASPLDLLSLALIVYLSYLSGVFKESSLWGVITIFAAIICSCYLAFRAFRG